MKSVRELSDLQKQANKILKGCSYGHSFCFGRNSATYSEPLYFNKVKIIPLFKRLIKNATSDIGWHGQVES